MDVPCDARTLVGDGPAELRLADRPPDTHEQDAVGDDAQEVALEHEVAGHDRSQHEVQVAEHRERRGETHPAVEIPSVPAEAQREAHERDEPEPGEHDRGDPDVVSRDGAGPGGTRGGERVHAERDEDESDRDPHSRRDERTATRRRVGRLRTARSR